MSQRPQADKSQISRRDVSNEPVHVPEENEAREEIRATLSALMPWGISILAHVALIVFAFFLVWQTIVPDPDQPPVVPRLTQAPEVSVPSSTIKDPLTQMPSGGAALSVEVAPVEPVEVTAVGFEMPALPIIGQGNGDWKNKSRGPGTSDTTPIIFPPLPPGSADVVFVIDASGSMVDVLPFVINELKHVVSGINAKRKATVIFFSGEGVFEVPGGGGVKGLRPMTAHFKTQVSEWVSLESFKFDTGGRGSAFVGDALTRALSYKPDRIVLLSDNLTGGGQGATRHELMQDDLLALIHQHNKKNPPVAIDTIQFLYEDPLVRAGLKGTLDRIADETGGTFRFITQRQLNLR